MRSQELKTTLLFALVILLFVASYTASSFIDAQLYKSLGVISALIFYAHLVQKKIIK